MIAIGIRVTPNNVYYSIIKEDSEGFAIVSISNIIVPKALDTPCKLSYIRNTLDTIIQQYNINKAGIKLIEGNARSTANSSTFFRVNLEGVILELFANSSVEKYLLGISSNIASILQVEVKPVKEMAGDIGIDDSDKTDEGKKLNDENKESIVVAIAALNQE